MSEFQCLDKATVVGVEYLAYRSVEAGQAQSSAPAHPVHRTVYVDPKTGLPAVNLVAEDTPGAVPVFKGVYSYPTDLVIEGYPGAPLAKVR